jgi:hypothetical protein
MIKAKVNQVCLLKKKLTTLITIDSIADRKTAINGNSTIVGMMLAKYDNPIDETNP